MDNNKQIRKYVPNSENSLFTESEYKDMSAELSKKDDTRELNTETEEALQYGFSKKAAKSAKKSKSSKKKFNHIKYRVIFRKKEHNDKKENSEQ